MILALILLVLLSPLMLAVAALIALESGGGTPIYGHRRYGKDGRTFLCYKFRSMALDADARLARLVAHDPAARAEWARDHKLRHDPRVTRIGRFIRRTSLDELPQLFNILRGEMSLVGPRPIVAAEVRRYGRHFVDYCSVRPGMTGIWQISGRNDIGYRRRVAMDCLMARRMSPRLYAEVLIGTARCVVTRQGAY
ncbi:MULTISPECIES: sugar transferase [Sphingomonas]|uniref:sugar transferase n=1 Tax=Sphingomonas TaxID=13687 RepID=UPI0002D3E6D8|nr:MULTISPECIES: sugar transferase [Sphingomonas]SUJ34581.1 Putative colanic biosynthesis UDP-glucose lipid carrier transferase [Sphingomonas paucimobilis]